jgi:glucosamine--fructose-6-phosphate aminotransferase (isomerizing)
MEVRGRDSAGISLLFALSAADYAHFSAAIGELRLQEDFARRLALQPLLNQGIAAHRHGDAVAVTFTYKVAVEIGSLGDNIRFLRRAIAGDPLLHAIVQYPAEFHTVNAHTRWASVGAITEANCHPVDNRSEAGAAGETGIIHACLNGDIDNFHELKEAFERSGRIADITTDTKIIPLQIGTTCNRVRLAESFRRAVGASGLPRHHATESPGKLFLAQRGSGQAIFVGIAPDHYMATSEVYGFIEEASAYVRLDGESIVDGNAGKTQGQLFVLDQAPGGLQDHRHVLRQDPRDGGAECQDHRTHLARYRSPALFALFLKEVSSPPLRWKTSRTAGKSGQPRSAVTALDESRCRRR